MQKRLLMCGALAAAGLMVMAGWATQPEKQPEMTDAMKKEAEMMAAMNAARPEHKLLADMCGEWDVTMKLFTQPGAEPMEVKALAHREMILGGHFMQEKIEGVGGPFPFTSISFVGYNPDSPEGGRFEVTRLSSTVLCMMPETGTYDEASKTFTFKGGHHVNGMHGSIRAIVTQVSKDEEKADVYLSFEGYSEQFKGTKIPEYKAMTMEYKRKK